MFTYINKQGVKSDKGFIVQRVGRFAAEYREDSKKITIDLENGILPNGKFCEIVQSDTFLSWDDGMPISTNKQAEIIRNFKAAMEFQEIGVLVR